MRIYVKPKLEFIELTLSERLAAACTPHPGHYGGACHS